jgi:flagellin
MRINFNASAVIANNALNRNDNRLQDSLARLSSGLKVVNAKDNPSGLAMSKKMNAQIKGLDQASDNAGDGVSIIEIADGAMSEMHDILQRINELAVKGSTGTITDDDRKLIQDEVKQLKEELTRISETVEFNGQTILDGSFDLRGYSNNQYAKVAYYSDEILAGTYTIDQLKVTYNADGTIDEVTAKNFGNGFPKDANVTSIDGNIVTIAGSGNFELKLRLTNDAAFTDLDLDLEGFGAMDMQIGANEGQQLGIRIPKMSLENMGISNIDLSTAEGANEAIDKVDEAIKYVSASRSRLGAYQNRLEHTVNNLDISSENMTAAYSRIMDVDMAEEMTEYTTVQILSQASTSMLAQANERPSQVLQLLQ